MINKYKLEEVKEFSLNLLIGHKSDIKFDGILINRLAKTDKNLIKGLIDKHSFTKTKLKFKLVAYNDMDYPHDAIIE